MAWFSSSAMSGLRMIFNRESPSGLLVRKRHWAKNVETTKYLLPNGFALWHRRCATLIVEPITT